MKLKAKSVARQTQEMKKKGNQLETGSIFFAIQSKVLSVTLLEFRNLKLLEAWLTLTIGREVSKPKRFFDC